MTELLTLSFILSLCINGIYIVMNWEGMLLENFGLVLAGTLQEWQCKMLFSCATCMSGIYGLVTFICAGYTDFIHLIAFVLMTACISTVINILLECALSLREYFDNELGRNIRI